MAENPPTPEAGKDDKSILVVNSPVKSAQETFELLTKIFVVVAAVLYVTGFLVVSLHLARYGVHSFSILRAQYILAGAWFFAHILFFVPLGVVIWYLIHRVILKNKNSTSKKIHIFRKIMIRETMTEKEMRLTVRIAIMAGIAIYFALFMFGISIFKFDKISTLASHGAINVLALITINAGWNTIAIGRQSKVAVFFLTLLLVVIFFLMVAFFSKSVYSVISAEYGGGMPVKVQFHWKDECKTRDIGAAFKKECSLKEEPVVFDQILATDSDHVIISPCPKEYPRTFEISNDLIDYVEIKYESKTKFYR